MTMHINAGPTGGPYGLGRPMAVNVERKGDEITGRVAGFYVSSGLMGTVMKIREGMARSDYSDPGPYKHPPGTVANSFDVVAFEQGEEIESRRRVGALLFALFFGPCGGVRIRRRDAGRTEEHEKKHPRVTPPLPD